MRTNWRTVKQPTPEPLGGLGEGEQLGAARPSQHLGVVDESLGFVDESLGVVDGGHVLGDYRQQLGRLAAGLEDLEAADLLVGQPTAMCAQVSGWLDMGVSLRAG